MARSAHRHDPAPPGASRLLGLARTPKKRPRQPRSALKGVYSGRAESRRPSHHVEAILCDQMLSLLPNLHAFALSLTNDPTRADDLVQDTILRAWTGISRFERGSNLGAWLFRILRNSFYSEYRKRKREVEDPDGAYVARLSTLPMQEAGLAMAEFGSALARLPFRQREALMLVGAEGLTYEDTAAIQGVAVGTVKSRVHRARSLLAELLQIGDWHEIGPDRVLKAALQDSPALHL
jgi:RNA polymerase sigma-70 factor, ECF subfamily